MHWHRDSGWRSGTATGTACQPHGLPVSALALSGSARPSLIDCMHWQLVASALPVTVFSSTCSVGSAASVTVMFKLCCLLFLLIGDAPWGCRTGLAREGAPGAEG
jgi:hypothetical protein